MRGCFFVNCDTIDAKWATLEAFLVIFKAFCLSVCTKPDNFDLDIYYDGKNPPLKEKSNQICKFYHELCIGSAQHHSILLQISPPLIISNLFPPPNLLQLYFIYNVSGRGSTLRPATPLKPKHTFFHFRVILQVF